MLIFFISQTYTLLNAKSKISFFLNATLHQVNGIANSIDSKIQYDSIYISGYVRVVSKSLKTGNGIRDAQMYRSIKADKYEYIEFFPDSLVKNAIFGKLKISGIERYISVPINMKFENNFTFVSGEFKILLSDFQITRPKFGFIEVSDTVNISFDLVYQKEQ
ncbi:MAG: YceI family protein [candidate division WOR-3 bacterium]|nr:YceI family protein [candidate division WOR-3 bacterium]MCX7947282.1 YceI family protein [candidate division WOR-3 bacterium]MDW8150161.1 YceI family protein [candidate division WOR-3 bacterium]